MRAKQVIIVRSDLNMGAGKIAAQVAHGAVANILACKENEQEYTEYESKDGVRSSFEMKGYEKKVGTGYFIRVPKETALDEWLHGSFFKVVLKVDSEEELLDVYNKAKDDGLITTLITDEGHTVFNGVPTNTVVAIGPHWDEEIDHITGNLKLL